MVSLVAPTAQTTFVKGGLFVPGEVKGGKRKTRLLGSPGSELPWMVKIFPARSIATATGLPVRLSPTATAVVPVSFAAQVPSGRRVYRKIPSPMLKLLPKAASAIHRKVFV